MEPLGLAPLGCALRTDVPMQRRVAGPAARLQAAAADAIERGKCFDTPFTDEAISAAIALVRMFQKYAVGYSGRSP